MSGPPAFQRLAVTFGLALLAAGCAPFGPYYHRPAVETPSAFKEQVGVSTAAAQGLWRPAHPQDAAPRGPWWERFGDPQLNELEKKIASANQSVQQAQAQVREARALVSVQRADYFPTIAAQPSVTRGYGPNNGGGRSSSRAGTFNDFTLPLNASWEPNIWGQTTLAVRGAAAAAQSSAALLENIRLSAQAELAADYFTLEADDLQETFLSSATASYVEALRLTVNRYNGGIASQVDVSQAQAQLSGARAQATDLAIVRAQLEHAIAVLVGEPPAVFALPVSRIQGRPPVIPAGVPAELLERRPDIASAERQVAAANETRGLARIAFFPTLSLTATGGYESGSLANWLSWPNRFWALGASAAETVLDFGRHTALNRGARAAYDAAVAGYRQTVLGAFQEVEDNLAAVRLLDEEAGEQSSATQAAEDSLRLETVRYKAGTVSYLDVITSQNIALTSERASAQLVGRQLSAAVALIRALGGGWDASQMPYPNNLKSRPPAAASPAAPLAPPTLSPVVVSSGPALILPAMPTTPAGPVCVSSASAAPPPPAPVPRAAP